MVQAREPSVSVVSIFCCFGLTRAMQHRHIAALQFVDVGRLELAAELTAAGPSGLLWKELGGVTLLFVE